MVGAPPLNFQTWSWMCLGSVLEHLLTRNVVYFMPKQVVDVWSSSFMDIITASNCLLISVSAGVQKDHLS